MAPALEDLTGTALRTRTEPLERRAFVDEHLGDVEVRLVETLVAALGSFTSVRDRALHNLEDGLPSGLRCELQHRHGLAGLLATDEVHDAPGLLGRDADEPRLRLGFHCCPAFLSLPVRASPG